MMNSRVLDRKVRLTLVGGLLLVLALIVAVVPVLAITWGQEDTDNEFSNVGAFLVSVPGPDGGLRRICSGTLIHERIVLTAGHCTDYANYLYNTGRIDGVYVSFSWDLRAEDAVFLPVAEVITHPDYTNFRPLSNNHDVGVLILEEPETGIPPATLPEEGFLDQLQAEGKLHDRKERARFTLVGYGVTLHWPPPSTSSDLRRQYAESEFQALLKAWLRMSQNQRTGDGGTCGGDSGGPAFWTEPDGTRILVGITSWGDMPCVATGFNYRADIPETLDFIADVMAGLD